MVNPHCDSQLTDFETRMANPCWVAIVLHTKSGCLFFGFHMGCDWVALGKSFTSTLQPWRDALNACCVLTRLSHFTPSSHSQATDLCVEGGFVCVSVCFCITHKHKTLALFPPSVPRLNTPRFSLHHFSDVQHWAVTLQKIRVPNRQWEREGTRARDEVGVWGTEKEKWQRQTMKGRGSDWMS